MPYGDYENQAKLINGIPPAIRWSDRDSEPNTRTVPTKLCQLPTERLGRMATTRTMGLQQLRHREHEDVAIQGELRIRPCDRNTCNTECERTCGYNARNENHRNTKTLATRMDIFAKPHEALRGQKEIASANPRGGT
ncbi:hypothetical protein RirG_021450 [Rhizophagus irregularis DAOM 197198w]|uniref:Uncharacterized protein n=1 Tax=Rhizophagus irregularis (strain DAOM 197198w) TaxID=1432141 RepID=A0A015KDN5_RHIIW|nr:hypothetical protein RirG_021450 [Rhizophagus irregularis DAOM 197198w]